MRYKRGSFVDIDERGITLCFAVAKNGVIDYTEHERQYLSFKHFRSANKDKTCLGDLPRAGYRYKYPRDGIIDNDCLLTFTITTSPVDGIRFRLTDHALTRFNTLETDKQIDSERNKEAETSDL